MNVFSVRASIAIQTETGTHRDDVVDGLEDILERLLEREKTTTEVMDSTLAIDLKSGFAEFMMDVVAIDEADARRKVNMYLSDAGQPVTDIGIRLSVQPKSDSRDCQ